VTPRPASLRTLTRNCSPGSPSAGRIFHLRQQRQPFRGGSLSYETDRDDRHVEASAHRGDSWRAARTKWSGFNFKNQVYAAHGYAVLNVNYRGSTGYGQKFADAVFGDQNGNEGQDVLYGVNAAVRRYLWMTASAWASRESAMVAS